MPREDNNIMEKSDEGYNSLRGRGIQRGSKKKRKMRKEGESSWVSGSRILEHILLKLLHLWEVGVDQLGYLERT